MIYEFRTYRVKVGAVGEVMKRFGESYENRKKLSELAAFWYTDIGPLNQIIHVWPYADMAERDRVRAESVKADDWPPDIAEFMVEQESEIFIPFPMTPKLEPGDHGPYYEMRYYALAAGSIPATIEAWEKAIGERLKRSPLSIALYSDVGRLNKFVHIWPYKSLDERFEIRKQAMADGVWPPKGGGGRIIEQNNKILLAAPFSPMQ